MSDRNSEITSPFVAKQLAWNLKNNVQQACTIINRRATNQGTPESQVDDQQKLVKLIGEMKWGYDHIGEAMMSFPIEDQVAIWCGGGNARKTKEQDLLAIEAATGVTRSEAEEMAKTRDTQMRAVLTLRRQGKMDAMVYQLETLLATDRISVKEPEVEAIRQACQKAYESAFLFGNWAEIMLIKDDMMYQIGEEPAKIEVSKEMQEKAEQIRAKLTEQQAERAAEEARKLGDFDVMSILAA